MFNKVLFGLFITLNLIVFVYATCGYYCDNDNQCTGDSCSQCNNGICSTGANCGGGCTVNSDCNQTSNCFNCVNGICTNNLGYCGEPCQKTDECQQNTACNQCINGVCGAACSATCTNSSQCNVSGSGCNFCMVGVCSQGGCGAPCSFQTDCAGNGNCTFCSAGFGCTSFCGGPCALNSDCGGNFNGCGSCINGVCQISQCGAACKPGSDNTCNSADGCTFCNPTTTPPNTCTLGLPCGSACEVNLDCDQTSSCTVCFNGVCSSTQGVCGSPCVVGNDNTCSGTTSCTYCNPSTGTCAIGLPCNSACSVNNDCNQTSTCPLCSSSGHCVSV